ncbi:MAG: phosphomannomutase [Pseudomonadota bacterium]
MSAFEPIDITCFKAYDVRGRLPDQLNEEVAYRIGRAYAEFLSPSKVIVGRDIRRSSEALKTALCRGLTDGGASVLDIGQCGTEEVYFATFDLKVDGGIMVTASHNPIDYNGLKFVREQSKPISGDNGLNDIRRIAEAGVFEDRTPGSIDVIANEERYVQHLLGYVDVDALKPLKVVCNSGNAGAGKVVDLLEPHLPFDFIRVHHDVDDSFPHGIPNPLLEENRPATIKAVKESGADIGIAWDGDYDRCFFFDESGFFIEGYYVVGLLASSFLAQRPDQAIVHDPRLTWNTVDIANSAGGTAVLSKTGHAFIKQVMRDHDAVYGGEMSAHHYFRDFAYCDSGMIPWLLVTGLVSATGKPLSELVAERMAMFPASGEINRTVADAPAVIARVENSYSADALKVDRTDGLSIEFVDWRFNLRSSNTEPLLRLNVESRADKALMQNKTRELLAIIDAD